RRSGRSWRCGRRRTPSAFRRRSDPMRGEGGDAERLCEIAGAMARSRRACRERRRILACALEAGGIGDWHTAPRYVRSAALACRLCRSDETRRAFARLTLFAESRAGRILQRTAAVPGNAHILALLA